MLPVRQTVHLSSGAVTLHAWGADVADGLLTDLLTLTATLGAMREEWHEFRRGDVEEAIWGTFWRLTQASLRGSALPRPLTWADRLTILTALWDLNDLEAADPKLTALAQRAQRMLARLSQGHPTEPSTST